MALKTGDCLIALPLRSVALRKAKIVCNLVFLSAIGLRQV